MPNVGTLKLEGFDELERALMQLGKKVAKKVTKSAMSKARRVVVVDIRERVPVRHGDLKRSIGAKRITRSRKQQATDVIGARSRKRMLDGKPINPANYAHIVEFGSKPHAIFPKAGGMLSLPIGLRPYVRHPGAKPQPFMRPAWRASAPKALSVFKREYAKGVRKAAAEARAGI